MARAAALMLVALANSAALNALRHAEHLLWVTNPVTDIDEEFRTVAAPLSSKPAAHAATTPLDFGRPWWAEQVVDAQGCDMRRRIKSALQFRLGLSAGLLNLVLMSLPVKFSLAAALAHTSEGWTVFVWEFAALHVGQRIHIYAGLVNRLLLHNSEWLDRMPPEPVFIPASETLAASVPEHSTSRMVIWDFRAGRNLRTMDIADILAVSRFGAIAIGNENMWGPPVIWNTHTGERVSPGVDGVQLLQYRCTEAVFGPGGHTAAALLVATNDHTDDPLWSVALYSSISGEMVCNFSSPTVEDDDLANFPAVSAFTFDGTRVTICRGLDETAIRLDVRWEADRCKLVHSASCEPCEDVLWPGSLRLEVEGTEVRVIRFTEGAGDEPIRRADFKGLGDDADGAFSPDGRKVLVCGWDTDLCYVWAFADGREPRLIETNASKMVFTADSSALLGVVEDGMEALCIGLDGRPALRFGSGLGHVTEIATGEVTDWVSAFAV